MSNPMSILRRTTFIVPSAAAAGATIATPPKDWEVPSHDGKSVIRLRSMSMFDINGVYSEINQHL